MFSELIDEADALEVVDPALHAKILAAVDATSTEQFSLTERFRAASYLQLATLFLAQQNGWKAEKVLPDGKGGHVSETVVDESKLPAEMAALRKLQDSLSYSPALQDLIAGRREDFIHELAADNDFGRTVLLWPEITEEEKRAFVQATVTRHLQGYSIAGVDIPAPTVRFDGEIKAAAAVTETELTREGDAIVPVVRGIKAGAGLRDAKLGLYAVILAYHESVHALLTSLAAAAARGTIQPDHPLYDDAALALADRLYGQAIPFIPSVYENDVEEKFVYAAERRFMTDLLRSLPPEHLSKDAPPSGPGHQSHYTP